MVVSKIVSHCDWCKSFATVYIGDISLPARYIASLENFVLNFQFSEVDLAFCISPLRNPELTGN